MWQRINYDTIKENDYSASNQLLTGVRFIDSRGIEMGMNETAGMTWWTWNNVSECVPLSSYSPKKQVQ